MLKIYEMLGYTQFDIDYYNLVKKIKDHDEKNFTEKEKNLYQYCINEGFIVKK
jgi:hypothetical protein